MEMNRHKRNDIRRTRVFRDTNAPWNDFNFNHGFSIGLMVKIMNDTLFRSFEEWEAYYFESGRLRQEALSQKPAPVRQALRDLRSVYPNPQAPKNRLRYADIELNVSHGRTLDELKELAEAFHQTLISINHPDVLTIEDCQTFVYIRVIDETYLGHLREVSTIDSLQKAYPKLLFRKTNAQVDGKYAVDVEVLNSRLQLIAGIQIKSDSFAKGKGNAMIKAQAYNLKKHAKYTQLFGVPAVFVYSSIGGRISNHEVLSILKNG